MAVWAAVALVMGLEGLRRVDVGVGHGLVAQGLRALGKIVKEEVAGHVDRSILRFGTSCAARRTPARFSGKGAPDQPPKPLRAAGRGGQHGCLKEP